MDSKTAQTPIDSLYKELDSLKEKNTSKRNELKQIRNQIEGTIQRRDTLNAEAKRIAGEMRKLKSERDSLNAKVKELKQKRDGLRSTAKQKREKLTKLLEHARKMSEQLPGSYSELSRQIKGLEWFIQTNPLSQKTERNLVSKMAALELSLAKHKGLRSFKDRLFELRVEVGALRLQAQSTHEELTKVALESEKVHESIQVLARALAEKRKDADARREEFVDQNKERRELADQIEQNRGRIDGIRTQIGEAKTLPKQKAEAVKSRYKEAANEKVRKGGKLSFEEFQAFMEDKGSDDDDD